MRKRTELIFQVAIEKAMNDSAPVRRLTEPACTMKGSSFICQHAAWKTTLGAAHGLSEKALGLAAKFYLSSRIRTQNRLYLPGMS
jgi:hypothetical protein